jgi:DNA invertase Pin-like site-specific DNA recombinase
MVHGYVRVSSKSQEKNNSLDEQEKEILDKYPVASIHREVFTAAKDFGNRAVFNTAVADLQAGDIFVVCKMDRFCRSVREGLSIIEELMDKGVTVHILNLGLIDDSSIGRLLFTVLLAFAEFERNMIVERTKLGREAARQKDGYKEGRPPKFSKEQINLAMQLLNEHSYKQVESMTGISKSTLQRARNKQEN